MDRTPANPSGVARYVENDFKNLLILQGGARAGCAALLFSENDDHGELARSRIIGRAAGDAQSEMTDVFVGDL